MQEVIIYDLSPDSILKLVNELRQDGYVLGIDFDYYYTPRIESFMSGNYEVNRRYTVFKFYNEQHASWFALKYG